MLDERRRAALAVLCTASFIAVVDTTILSVALPSIRHGLGFSTTGVQWVLNAYALVFGGMLLLFGRLGDRYGRRRLFLAGLVVFGAGSLLAGAAWSQVALIAGRVVQGAGAAAFVPASLSLLTATFTNAGERSRAVGVYGAMAGLGFVVGMAGGGLVTQVWGWRWTLLVNVPAVLVILLPGRRVIDESRDDAATGRVDAVGAVAVTGGLALTLFAVTSATANGRRTAAIAALLGIGLLATFAAREVRLADPLVPPAVLRSRPVLVTNAAVALQSMIGIAWLYVLTLHFQEVLGRSPLEAGLLFAPMTLAAVVAATSAGRLVTRTGVRPVAVAGLVAIGAGLALMTAGLTPDGSLPLLLAGMVVGESGFMLANVALTVAGTGAVAAARSGLAAGLLNTSMQLGGGWGLGVVSAVVGATFTAGHGAAGYAWALRWGLVTCLGFCALSLVLVVAALGGQVGARRQEAVGPPSG